MTWWWHRLRYNLAIYSQYVIHIMGKLFRLLFLFNIDTCIVIENTNHSQLHN